MTSLRRFLDIHNVQKTFLRLSEDFFVYQQKKFIIYGTIEDVPWTFMAYQRCFKDDLKLHLLGENDSGQWT